MDAVVLRGRVPTGYGYGYGYGSGYGYGDGYGYGSGDGSGYGYGDGYGYGSGSGYGDGSGYGYGDGSKEYWLGALGYWIKKWSDAQRSRLQSLKDAGVVIAFWWSDKKGRACNGGTNQPISIGTVEKVDGPLVLCERGTLHATALPPRWRGDRLWCVALHGEVIGDNEKYGALEREILGECI